MLAVPFPFRIAGIGLHQIPAVGKQQFAQFERCVRAQHGPLEPVAYQSWNVARMIKVGVREKDRID